jgi:hypothetical protein
MDCMSRTSPITSHQRQNVKVFEPSSVACTICIPFVQFYAVWTVVSRYTALHSTPAWQQGPPLSTVLCCMHCNTLAQQRHRTMHDLSHAPTPERMGQHPSSQAHSATLDTAAPVHTAAPAIAGSCCCC